MFIYEGCDIEPTRAGKTPGMRVVLDTNVIISGLNFPGNEWTVLELALRGWFELVLSWFILGEVDGVLTRKYGWDHEQGIWVNGALQSAVTVIEPPRLDEVIEGGHADNLVLECAVTASADYLITGASRPAAQTGQSARPTQHTNDGVRISNAIALYLAPY